MSVEYVEKIQRVYRRHPSWFRQLRLALEVRRKERKGACFIPLVFCHEFQDESFSYQLLFYKWKHFRSRSCFELTEELTFQCKPLRCAPKLFPLPRPSCRLTGEGNSNSTSSSCPRHFTASTSLVLARQMSHGARVEPSALWQRQLQKAQPTASNQRKSCKNSFSDLLGDSPLHRPWQ